MRKEDILTLANSFVGTCEGSEKHIKILNAYNNYKPLARGYKVKMNDAWCMTFISSLFIMLDSVDAIGKTECGCQEYIDYAKANKLTVTKPAIGNLVFYDWGNDGVVDHVGIISNIYSGLLEVIEGNKSDMVQKRIIAIGNPAIKYYVRPKYNSKVSGFDADKVSYAQSFDKTKAGKYVCTAYDFVALRYNPFVDDFNKIAEIKKGETCHNYGYYTNGWLLVTYQGLTGFANEMHLKKVGK